MRRLLAVGLLLGIMFLWRPAQAGLLQLNSTSFPNGNLAVTLPMGGALSGPVDLNVTDLGSGISFTISEAVCINPFIYLHTPALYGTFGTSPTLTAGQVSAIAALLGNAHANGNNVYAAAMQNYVWHVVSPGLPILPYGGDDAALAQANIFEAQFAFNIANHIWNAPLGYGLELIMPASANGTLTTDNQGFAALHPVPEPAPIAALGLGLIALGIILRRRA